jgi:hypothetical protein
MANQRVEANRRHAFPIHAGQPFVSALCASPCLTATVAHPGR